MQVMKKPVKKQVKAPRIIKWVMGKDGVKTEPKIPGIEYVTVLSQGAGVQGSYMLLKHWKRYLKGYVVMADVGAGDRTHAERKITYNILDDLLIPFCKEKGIKFHIAKADEGIWEWHKRKGKIPRRFPRDCTRNFKVRPLRRFYRKELKANFRKKIIVQDIGFTHDEAHRADFTNDDPKYTQRAYPLLDWNITRKDCLIWLQKHYPDIPWYDAKSGCWFCPFQKDQAFRKLEKWQQDDVIALEQNVKNKKHLFKSLPMFNIVRRGETSLDDYDGCDTGYCMK